MPSNFEVIHPTGVLDNTYAEQFRNQVTHVLDKGAKVVLINLKDVTFMDSSGLAALVVALKNVRAIGGQLYVCSINDQVRLLFELTNMTKVFEVFPSQDDFVRSHNLN